MKVNESEKKDIRRHESNNFINANYKKGE